MTRRSPTRRWTAWIAALALVFAAVAPVVAHVLPAPDGWVEVCTVQGSKWVRAADAAASNEAPAGVHEHCLTCSSHELPALPVPEAAELGLRRWVDAAPAPTAAAPWTPRDGGFAQPRAPPAGS